MRIATLTSIFCLFAAAAFVACSSSSGGGNTGGGGGMVTGGTDGGGAGGSGGTSASGGAGGTSGGTGYCTASDCGSDQPISGPGGTDCYCDDLCHGNNDCCPDKVSVCGQGTGGTGGGGPNLQLPTGCVTNSGFATPCNPVTNEGCTAAGSACDGAQGGVQCYPDGNTEAAGAPCAGPGTTKGKYCVPKYTCAGASETAAGTCKKWCCSNSDCNGGTCKAIDATNIGTLGWCEGGSTDGGGGTGGTDAGSDAATDATAD